MTRWTTDPNFRLPLEMFFNQSELEDIGDYIDEKSILLFTLVREALLDRIHE